MKGFTRRDWENVYDLMRAIEQFINFHRTGIASRVTPAEQSRIASRLRWLADNIEGKHDGGPR